MNVALQFEYKVLDISQTPIEIEDGLDSTMPENIEKISDEHLKHLAAHLPPILLTDSKSFILVDRQWCYRLQIERGKKQILFFIYHDNSGRDFYKKHFFASFNTFVGGLMKLLVATISKATQARRKAMYAQRSCPFCGDALMKPVGKWTSDDQGYFRCHCYNSKQA